MSDAGQAGPAFRVEAIAFQQGMSELHQVRDAVFVREQGVPVEIERDALDPLCVHVIARDGQGQPIGTGRLTPDHRIGRMAVLPDWRGQGVGAALLRALLWQARQLRWPILSLHAQVPAIVFYARQGFLPYGDRFVEAGLDHQSMRLVLDSINAVERRDAGVAATVGVIASARRHLCIYSRELDPGLFDQPEVLTALRHFAVAGGEVRILLQDPAAPQRAIAPVLALAQRLSSTFGIRAIEEPVDRDYPAAYVANDNGGWYYRPLGHRFDGETRLDDPAHSRQLQAHFAPVWERARPCSEFRALGL